MGRLSGFMVKGEEGRGRIGQPCLNTLVLRDGGQEEGVQQGAGGDAGERVNVNDVEN